MPPRRYLVQPQRCPWQLPFVVTGRGIVSPISAEVPVRGVCNEAIVGGSRLRYQAYHCTLTAKRPGKLWRLTEIRLDMITAPRPRHLFWPNINLLSSSFQRPKSWPNLDFRPRRLWSFEKLSVPLSSPVGSSATLHRPPAQVATLAALIGLPPSSRNSLTLRSSSSNEPHRTRPPLPSVFKPSLLAWLAGPRLSNLVYNHPVWGKADPSAAASLLLYLAVRWWP